MLVMLFYISTATNSNNIARTSLSGAYIVSIIIILPLSGEREDVVKYIICICTTMTTHNCVYFKVPGVCTIGQDFGYFYLWDINFD